jgi:hypothetical protein
MIAAVFFAISFASQCAWLVHHVQRGEPWGADACVAALCGAAMLARARQLDASKAR